MSRKSKKRAKQAIPEEILAEGSGPHAEADPVDPADGDPVVEADAQALADAASDALASAEIGTVEAEVEAAAMAAEVVVTAAEVARAEERDKKASKKKRGRKAQAPAAVEPEVKLDAWGQPILVEEEPPPPEAAEALDAPEAVASVEAVEAVESDETIEASGEALESDHAEMAADEAVSDEAVSDEALSDEPALEAAASDDTGADLDTEDGLEGEGDPEGEPDAEGATLPTSAATLDTQELKNLVEALVFAADKPVTIQRLRQLTRVSDVRRLEAALGSLAEDYKARGIALTVVSGGYQFRTNTTYSTYVQQLIAGRPVRLSRAQLETLAIVAYRQPITRPEIDEIRGVDSSSTLKVLLDRALIRILGKREEAGRPTLYGTTKEFLDFFSLGDLRELPTLREYSELTAESRKVVSDRLGVGLEGAPADAAAPTDQPLTEDAAPSDPPLADDAAPSDPPLADEVAPSDPIEVAPSEMDLAADSMEAGDEPHVDEPHVDAPPAETNVEAAPAMDSPADEAPAAEQAFESSADIATDESHVEASAPELAATSAEVTDEPHMADVEPELAAHAEPELAADADAELAADVSGESHVEPAGDAAELSASADADDAAEEPVHTFIDPEELAGRVVSGESDTLPHDESASELQAAPADETWEHSHDAVDPDATDTSAPDDPPVD